MSLSWRLRGECRDVDEVDVSVSLLLLDSFSFSLLTAIDVFTVPLGGVGSLRRRLPAPLSFLMADLFSTSRRSSRSSRRSSRSSRRSSRSSRRSPWRSSLLRRRCLSVFEGEVFDLLSSFLLSSFLSSSLTAFFLPSFVDLFFPRAPPFPSPSLTLLSSSPFLSLLLLLLLLDFFFLADCSALLSLREGEGLRDDVEDESVDGLLDSSLCSFVFDDSSDRLLVDCLSLFGDPCPFFSRVRPLALGLSSRVVESPEADPESREC